MTISRRMVQLEQLFGASSIAGSIDDTTTATDKLWSSDKVSAEFDDLGLVYASQGALDAKINSSLIGAVNGVASLDASGLVPAGQLPSYVDDVLEYANLAALPVTGTAGKIYVTLDNNKTYRWSGSAYVNIAASPGSTDVVTEGATNLYFTTARVLATAATGLVDTAGTPAATDTLITVLGKVKKGFFTDHAGQGGAAHANVIAAGAAGFMTGADKTKLDGIAAGATVNSTDAALRDRANHTGTQGVATIAFGATARLFGRASPGAGVGEEIIIGAGLLLTGTTLTAPGGGGGGLVDADYGDVLVTGGGTAMTVQSAASGFTINGTDVITAIAGKLATAGKAADSSKSDKLSVFDNRSTDEPPSTYTTASITPEFRSAGKAGATTGYSGVLTVSPWTDDSGGGVSQLIFDSGGTGNLRWRYGSRAGGWGTLRTIWHDGNFDPSLKLDIANFTFANLGTKPTTLTGYGITDAIPASQKGAVNGVAPLDSGGLISATYLPSYVDDVLEYANLAAFPVTGTAGKIYVPLDTNKTYRWSGSAYVEISASPGSTDVVTEGATNLYFTNARAIGAPLTGFSTATNSVVVATDTIVAAIGKAQAQISANKTKLDGIAAGATANDTDANLKNRANHTGTQAITTTTLTATARIAGRTAVGAGAAEELTGTQVTAMLDTVVAAGAKGLMTGADKTKLDGIGTDWTVVVLAADYTSTTTATQDVGVNIAAASLAAGGVYEIELHVMAKVSANRLTIDFVMPTGCTSAAGYLQGLAGVAGSTGQVDAGTANISTLNPGANTIATIIGQAIVVTGVAAATAATQVKIGITGGAATLTVLKGSFIKYRKIA